LKKNFFEIGRAGYQKKRNFALISKMCGSLEFCKREKHFYRKTEFLGTWKILQKIVFLRKNLWELLERKSSTHFFNQGKIPLLLIPSTANFEEIFFQLL
jgi:hypothetical protein